MKLYVMRHGPAEDQAESGRDADRGLTAAGRARVRAVAGALTDFKEEPFHIVTSPLVRAVQTAEIVAILTRLDARGGALEARHDLAPGGNAAALARKLASEGRKRVMFVGHEPDLSSLAATLLGEFDRSFDKAMVLGLHLASGAAAAGTVAGARLRFVLDPRALRMNPDARTAS